MNAIGWVEVASKIPNPNPSPDGYLSFLAVNQDVVVVGDEGGGLHFLHIKPPPDRSLTE